MIRVEVSSGSAETLDGRDAHGRYLTFQLGPILLMLMVGRAR